MRMRAHFPAPPRDRRIGCPGKPWHPGPWHGAAASGVVTREILEGQGAVRWRPSDQNPINS